MDDVSKSAVAHFLKNRDKWLRELANSRDLKHLSVRVGLHLAMRMTMRTQEAWPSIETISNDINASQRGVIGALDELTEEGFLGIERRRNKGNRYWLRFKWQ